MMMAEIFATSQSRRGTAMNARLAGLSPKVTTGKAMPNAEGCIYRHILAGHLFSQDSIHRCWRSLTSGDP